MTWGVRVVRQIAPASFRFVGSDNGCRAFDALVIPDAGRERTDRSFFLKACYLWRV